MIINQNTSKTYFKCMQMQIWYVENIIRNKNG